VAPVRRVTDVKREVAPLVHPNTDDLRRGRETQDQKGCVTANKRHVDATGVVMPQGGKHRRKNRG
jgi:hypothetical protein